MHSTSKYFGLLISILILSNCSDIGRSRDNWNLLGGSYWKHGEMIAYDGYWVEAYKDTTTNSYLVLFVNKDNFNLISDSLRLGELPEGISFDYGTVELNEQVDRSLVALYTIGDSSIHYSILKAWRANSSTGKFEEIKSKGIRIVKNP